MNTKELAELLSVPDLPNSLERVEKRLQATLEEAGTELGRPARRLLNSGGKRLRPSLVVATASLGGRLSQASISAAAAVELVHLASLIHDDIIDGSKFRRGVPTINELEGTTRAILVGDYLLAAGLDQAAAVSRPMAHELAAVVLRLCEGQTLELTGNYRHDPRDNLYIDVCRKKSGSLIKASCRIGGLSAGLTNAEIDALGKYGESFGTAFQIIDDITDEDFNKNLLNIAVSEAKRYSSRAADALKKLPDHPVADGLAKLPGAYIDTALAKIKSPPRLKSG